MLPVTAAMPDPATTPTVWAMASQPPTAPRCREGTWSGTVAVSAASIAFRVPWAIAQPSTITATESAVESTSIDDHRADQAADHPRQPATDAQDGAVGEGAPHRVEHRRDGRADPEDQRERRLLVLGADRLRLLREQHLDRAEEPRADRDRGEREPGHPQLADRAGRLGQRGRHLSPAGPRWSRRTTGRSASACARGCRSRRAPGRSASCSPRPTRSCPSATRRSSRARRTRRR